ncbi:MAG: nucleotidyltransferase domain-containing protein [Candidatus Aenigmarchaeota archaeon]|nr:nucleotidyltransferase domain-containing protein [Candidatus Aenigmarchaeota archaeon]
MDIYKVRFTALQQEMLRFLFLKSGARFTERSLAGRLKASPTAVSNSLPLLQKERLIAVTKDPESGRLSISLNKENPKVFFLKRIENLRAVYESGLPECLSETFPGCAIILFGSYSFGEDAADSDIDIAIVGTAKKEVAVEKFRKLLERRISLNFYPDFRGINKSLKENILNGIVLNGSIRL